MFPVNRWGTMCTAAALNATPCDCYGGASRRAAKIEELRARAPNRTAVVDMGGFFFGSGLAYPTFGGNASARYFAATGYDAYGLHWRDLTPSATDAGASLARYVDRLRALDPGLPPAVTTNLNLSGTALGAAHVRPWTLVDVGGARASAPLADGPRDEPLELLGGARRLRRRRRAAEHGARVRARDRRRARRAVPAARRRGARRGRRARARTSPSSATAARASSATSCGRSSRARSSASPRWSTWRASTTS